MAVLATVGLVLTFEALKLSGGSFQGDFRGDLYSAAHAIMHGTDPYYPKLVQAEADSLRAGHMFGYHPSPRYPPLLMLAVVPVSMLPFPVAGLIFFLLSVAAVVVAMRVLGVRDWRAMTVASISVPALYSSWLGNVTTLLLLGTAVVWRYRDDAKRLGLAAGCVIGAKLFLWPLGLWMLVTKRYRQLAMTIVATVGVLLGTWAVIGFAGLASYPQLLVNVAYIGELRGSSLVSELLRAGVPTLAARAVALSLTGLLTFAAWRLSRRPDGGQRAFGLIVAAALIASPVVWLHSLVLLYVPIALLSPRLSPLWFVPAFAGTAPALDLTLEAIVIAAICAPLLRSHVQVDGRLFRPRVRLRRLPAVSALPAPKP
jgi:Glycosyltransferase family 87